MKIQGTKLLSVDESDLINGVFSNSKVTELADGCFYNMRGLVKLVLPKVKTMGNDCISYNDKLTSVSLPVCTTMGNYCIRSNAALTSVSLPVCTTMGDGCISSNAALTSVSLPVCTTMGDGCISSNAALTSVSLPVCTTMGEYCISSNAALTSVSLPVCTTMGNGCIRNNASLTSVSLPVCTTMGNDCISNNAALTSVSLPVCTTMGNYCISSNAALTSVSIRKKKYNTKNVDGSCFVIEGEKTSNGIKIYTGYNFVGMEDKKLLRDDCYVAEKDGFFAHGRDLKSAVGDLQFKIVAEKLKSDPINEDTELTVMYYRTLTGACDHGCRNFMDAHNIPYKVVSDKTVELSPMKAKDLLPLLKKNNAYGYEKFKSLLTF